MSATALVRTEAVNDVLVATLTTATISEYESGLIIEQVQKAAAAAGWRVVMDFEQVQFLSSPGISMILTLVHDAKKGKGKLVICNLNDDIHEIFKMTKVDKGMNIVPTRDEAMKKVG